MIFQSEIDLDRRRIWQNNKNKNVQNFAKASKNQSLAK